MRKELKPITKWTVIQIITGGIMATVLIIYM